MMLRFRKAGPLISAREAALFLRRAFLAAAACLAVSAAQAQVSGFWTGQGLNSNWQDGANWTTNPSVPSLPGDTAYFLGYDSFSGTASPLVQLSGPVSLQYVYFESSFALENYNIDTNGNFLSVGNGYLFNNTGANQTLTNATGSLYLNGSSFMNSSGGFTVNNGNATGTGFLGLWNGSSGGASGGATLNNNGGTIDINTGSSGGLATFNNNLGDLKIEGGSTAGSAILNNNADLNVYDTSDLGSSTLVNNGSVTLHNYSTAAGSTITNNDYLEFDDSSTAANSTLTNTGNTQFFTNATAGAAGIYNTGTLGFSDNSTAGGATIFNGNNSGGTGTVDFHSSASAGGATITNYSNGAVNFYNGTTAGAASFDNFGSVNFYDASTAGNANINNDGGGYGQVNFYDDASAGAASIYNGAWVYFYNNSTAGAATIDNEYDLEFHNNSSAGSATLLNDDTAYFYDDSTAGNAAIDNQLYLGFLNSASAGSASILNNGTVTFGGTATAGNGSILNNSEMDFGGSSTAGAATVTSNAAAVYFHGLSDGGTAQFILNNNSLLDISGQTGGIVTVGSIQDDNSGTVFLGGDTLAVGSNNMSTTFGGLIADGGANGGSGGSLDKIGTGTLTLTGANTYTGRTEIDGGILNVNNDGNLGMSGQLTLNGGTLQASVTPLLLAQTITLGNNGGTIDTNGDFMVNAGSASGTGNLSVTGGGLFALVGNIGVIGLGGNSGNSVSLSCDNLNVTNVQFGLVADTGTLNGGAGGNATINAAGLATLDPSLLVVNGGNGADNSGGDGGAGGVAAVTLGGLNTTGSDVSIASGNGGNATGGSGNGGDGGNSNLVIGSDASVDSSAISIAGGTAGNSNSANGGRGGDGLLGVSNAVSLDSSDIQVQGGSGGNSAPANGGNGGNAVLTAGSVVLNNASQVGVYGGIGGNGNTDGNGGSAYATIGSLNLVDSSSYLYVEGGSGLVKGNAAVSIGSLVGAGVLDESGNNPTLQVAGGDFSGQISGNEGLEKTGSGLLTLTGTSIYSGATTLSGGVVNIQNDSNLGNSGSLYFNGGALQAGANLNTAQVATLLSPGGTVDMNGYVVTWNGSLSGTGALSMADSAGGGELKIPGAQNYAGGTKLYSGTLSVGNAGSLGTGGVTLYGGTLAAANGPMTIGVGGNYAQGPLGTLQLGLGGTTAGQWDVLNVGGVATLGGALKVTSYSGFTPAIGSSFLAVTATGGVSGAFGNLASAFTGINLMPVYQGHDVVLEAEPSNFASVATTGSGIQVGNALNNLWGNPKYYNLFAFLGTQTASQLAGDYNLIPPGGLTPVYQIGFSNAQAQAQLVGQRLETLMGGSGFGLGGSALHYNSGEAPMFAGVLSAEEERMIAQNVQSKDPAPAASTQASASPAAPDDWGVFVSGAGNFGSLTGNAVATGYNFSTGGMTAGMDHRFGHGMMGGLVLAFTQSGATTPGGTTVNVTGGQLGFYGGLQRDAVHVEALLSGGVNNYTTKRSALGGTADGSTQGLQYSGQLSGGYDFTVDKAKVGPFASAQYTYVQMNGFTETGSLAPATVPSQGEDSFLTDLGAKAGKSLNVGGGLVLSPNVSAAWEHVYQGNQDSLNATLGTATSQFSVNGPLTGTDGIVVGAGVNARFTEGLNGYVQYQGKLGFTNYDSQSFDAGVNFGF